MIPAKKGVYDFRRKGNLSNSGQSTELPLVDIIAYLNEGQEIVFENRVFRAQTNKKTRYDLRPVLKSKQSLEFSKVDSKCYLASFPKDIYQLQNQYAVAVKDCCEDIEKEIIIRVVQSDDLHEARQNPYRKADFFYEQLLGIEDSSGLLVYHEDEMDLLSIIVDYYRKPGEIHAPSLKKCKAGEAQYYDYCGNVISKDTFYELDNTYIYNQMVDVAVLLYKKDKQLINDYQLQLSSVLQNEKIYT